MGSDEKIYIGCSRKILLLSKWMNMTRDEKMELADDYQHKT